MTRRRPGAADGAPRLDLTGPIRSGGLAALAAVACIAALTTLVEVDDGPVVSTLATIRSEPVAVRHETGGTLVEIAVRDGATVKAGDRIARFDPRPIEAQISALTKQISGKRLQMDGLRQETEAVVGSAGSGSDPGRVARLHASIAELDRDLVGLTTQLMFAEEALKHVDVRAAVDGLVTEVAVASAGVVVPARARLLSIRPSADLLVLTVPMPVIPVFASSQAAPTQARVQLAGGLPMSRVFAGRVDGEAVQGAGGDVRVTIDLAGTPLADMRDRRLAFDVQFVTRTVPLARYLLSPIWRSATASGRAREGAAS